MQRADDQTLATRRLGTVVSILGVLLFIALFLSQRTEGLFASKATVRADFRTITGLRRGSPVQLAGVRIGQVDSIDFAHVEYECDYLTEDIGRYGGGRTDNCDDFLFCAPAGLCADLEPFAGRGHHAPCRAADECSEEEVCVTSEMRKRSRKVPWSGPLGVCARFRTLHWRTQVRMAVRADKLDIIRNDSRATIAANSILGDQLVRITTGVGDPLTGQYRVQAVSSVYEDIARLRQRLDRITLNADISMQAIGRLINELKDERTVAALKGTFQHVEVISSHFAEGRGLVPALVGSKEYRRDFDVTIRSIRKTADGLDVAVQRTNGILEKVDRNLVPVVDDTRAAVRSADQLLVDLDDPKNKSLVAKFLRDEDGELAEDLAGTFANTAEITSSTRGIARAVKDGDGSLGRAINDPIVAVLAGKLLENAASHDWVRWLANFVLEVRDGSSPKDARDSVRNR